MFSSFGRALKVLCSWAIASAAFLSLVEGRAETTRYLIISAPRLSKVLYAKIGDGGTTPLTTHPLIDSGLRSPQGVAVDQPRGKLYVADPDSRKIFSYNLRVAAGSLFADGDQTVAVSNVEARWVAVDILGHVFFSDERLNKIQKASAGFLQSGGKDGAPVDVYTGQTVPQVSAPGGIAVDNFHIFWANKRQGTQVGSVVKGPERQNKKPVRAIANNAVKVYGVCLADHNVYYTENGHLFGVKKMGGAFAEISSQLVEPRGCVWDGDGSVYVADKAGNAVYSFPGNMHSLAASQMTKVLDTEDAFGLAMLNGGAWRRAVAGVVAMLAALHTFL